MMLMIVSLADLVLRKTANGGQQDCKNDQNDFVHSFLLGNTLFPTTASSACW